MGSSDFLSETRFFVAISTFWIKRGNKFQVLFYVSHPADAFKEAQNRAKGRLSGTQKRYSPFHTGH